MIGVGDGARHEPNLRATQVELHEGLTAVIQNRWPSLKFDVGAINNSVSRFIPGGFYYKTFMWPKAFWKHVYEPFIRRAAGLGKAPEGRDPDTYEHLHAHCDVLVIGGGVAGLAAAEAAAATGARVIIADENPMFGGLADISGGTIGDASQLDWVAGKTAALAEAENVHVLTRTTAVGHWHHNYVMLFERLADHDPALLAAGTPRQRLWKVRAHQVILATGAIERPIAFANNDRPGVMLASAARAMVERYGVAPGSSGVIFTNNDDAYQTALVLKSAGVLVRVVDSRGRAEGALPAKAREAGIEVDASSIISAVNTSFGGLDIASVKVAAYRKGQGRVIKEKKVDCDFVAMSGGWNPVLHLWCHNGGKIRFDDALQAFRPDRHHDAIHAVGAANGTFALDAILAESYAAGEKAAKSALPRAKLPKLKPPAAVQAMQSPLEPLWFAPATGKYNEGNKHFIDFQNDVTAADLELAQREGYEFGRAHQALHHLRHGHRPGQDIQHQRPWRLVGSDRQADPRDRHHHLPAALHALHLRIDGRNAHQAALPADPPDAHLPVACRPQRAFRAGGAMAPRLYLSRRGRRQAGRDQARNPLCAEQGRPARCLHPRQDRDQGAGRRRIPRPHVHQHVLDAEGRQVPLRPDDERAGLPHRRRRHGAPRRGSLPHAHHLGRRRPYRGLAGGMAADRVDPLQGLRNSRHGAMGAVRHRRSQGARRLGQARPHPSTFRTRPCPTCPSSEGRLGRYPVRLFRISFSGELSYEVATPSNLGRGLWNEIVAAGAANSGSKPYGTEALHVLRAEKGYIVIGDETDGTTTPIDVGLDGLVSKKKADFIGKRSLEQSYLKGPNRKQLVGLLTEDPNEVLPDGAYAVKAVKDKPPMEMIGQVTSTYMSPTLGRSIAMALIENGRARMGETISFPLEGNKVMRAKIVDPVFYDKEGSKLNV